MNPVTSVRSAVLIGALLCPVSVLLLPITAPAVLAIKLIDRRPRRGRR